MRWRAISMICSVVILFILAYLPMRVEVVSVARPVETQSTAIRIAISLHHSFDPYLTILPSLFRPCCRDTIIGTGDRAGSSHSQAIRLASGKTPELPYLWPPDSASR